MTDIRYATNGELYEIYKTDTKAQKYAALEEMAAKQTKTFYDQMREKWVGKTIMYRGEWHTVVDVDHNGGILIDLADSVKNDTAIKPSDIEAIR